jgi:hypothetical protein
MRPVTFHEGSGQVTRRGIVRATRQEVEVLFHELLELRFPEWAAAEGSRGEFEWDVENDELTHRHHWRVVVYEEVTVLGVSAAAG